MLFSSRPFLLFYVTSPVWGAVTPNLSWIGVSPVPSYYRHFSLSLVSQTSETKQNKNDKPNDNSKPQEFSSPSSEATSALLPLSAKLLSHGYQCPHFHPHNKTSWFGALSPKVKFIIVLYIPPTCSLKIIYMTFQTILCLEQHFVVGDFSTCGVLLGLRNFDFEAFLVLTVQTGDVWPVPPGCTELCKQNDIIHILHLAPRTLTDINNHLLLLLYLIITSVRAPFLYEAQLASFEVSPLQTSDLCPSQALNFWLGILLRPVK